MPTFKHSFIGVAVLLLAVATYVVLAGREAVPTTTGEVTPISCLSQAHECVTATL